MICSGRQIFRSRSISKQLKLRCIKNVKPAVVVGRETWVVTEMDMERMGTWERKMLRGVRGQVVEQGYGE